MGRLVEVLARANALEHGDPVGPGPGCLGMSPRAAYRPRLDRSRIADPRAAPGTVFRGASNGPILAYALELPERPGAVQEEFHVEPEGRSVLAIKNPEAGTPAGMGLDGERRAEFPEGPKERFGDCRWVAADPPEFLACAGAELVLIGGRDEAAADLDIDLEPQPEDENSAEVSRDLHLERSERAVKPLFEETWR